MKKLWLGDSYFGGRIVCIEHTHYQKIYAYVKFEDGRVEKYLV